MNSKLRIALDLDDCIFDFFNEYRKIFDKDIDLIDSNITRNVWKLEYNKPFWENLPLLERPDFTPYIYATKRIIRKQYTKNCLNKYNLPLRPIYQTLYQYGNKADIIKGKCDVLIDDSYSNVIKAIEKGVPALLIERPHNIKYKFKYTIKTLSIKEIEYMYNLQIEQLWFQKT